MLQVVTVHLIVSFFAFKLLSIYQVVFYLDVLFQAADIQQSITMETTDTSEVYEQYSTKFPETHGTQVCTLLIYGR